MVNPDAYGSEGRESPEGEAFVLQMQEAWEEWVRAGSVGANGAVGMRRGGVGVGVVYGIAVGVGVGLVTGVGW